MAARNSDLASGCVRRARPLMAHLAPTLTGPVRQMLRWQRHRPKVIVLPGAVQARTKGWTRRSRPVQRPALRLTT